MFSLIWDWNEPDEFLMYTCIPIITLFRKPYTYWQLFHARNICCSSAKIENLMELLASIKMFSLKIWSHICIKLFCILADILGIVCPCLFEISSPTSTQTSERSVIFSVLLVLSWRVALCEAQYIMVKLMEQSFCWFFIVLAYVLLSYSVDIHFLFMLRRKLEASSVNILQFHISLYTWCLLRYDN